MNATKLFAATAAIAAAIPLAATATTTIVHDAARDLCLNQANAATYTNVYGGVWTFMRADSTTGTRSIFEGVRTNGYERSGQTIICQRGPARDNSNNPRFSVNPTAWTDTTTSFRGDGFPYIAPGSLSCHPGKSEKGFGCAVLRFTVPRSGTYRVVARAWDQNTGTRGVSLLVNDEVRARQQVASATPAARASLLGAFL